MIKIVISLSLLILTGVCKGQSKGNSEATKPSLTLETAIKEHNYPVMKRTANAEKDQVDYKAAKIKWNHDNPELYKRLFPEVPSSKSGKVSAAKKLIQASPQVK